MRLHRLTLTNYRGIDHRDIEFPEQGVTVVSGANEAGKSSMIEALDLLLHSKDRSTRKDVKAVKPTHADVGAEVCAEMSTGPYRFVYRKRFHKKCETELTVLAPRRAQLTGDEAHERVLTMFAETVDTGLWQAQRVLQSAATTAVDLSGCDALARALDVAAGETESTPSGAEPLLIERIDAEYARYFTATGRPTGEWAAANGALRAAEADVQRCRAAVAEVEERADRHAALSAELGGLDQRRSTVRSRREAAELAAEAVDALAGEVEAARAAHTAAEAAATAAADAHQDRLRLCAEVESRRAALAGAEVAAVEAAEAEATGKQVVVAAEEAVAAAAEAQQRAERRAETAARQVDGLAARAERERLTARLERIEETGHEIDRVADRLVAITLTDTAIGDIENAATAAEVARARAEQVSASLTFTAEQDLEFTVGDRTVTLTAGQSWSATVADATVIRLPAVLTTKVEPGATAADMHAKAVAAQRKLDDLLAAVGVPDVAGARELDRRRRDLLAARDRLAATAAGLRGDDDVDALRDRLAELRAREAGEAAPAGAVTDLASARAELQDARELLRRTGAECATRRKVLDAAIAQLSERSTRATVSRDRVASAAAELEVVCTRLAGERDRVTDEQLTERSLAAAGAAERAGELVTALSQRLAAAGPGEVQAELATARADDEELNCRYESSAAELHDLGVELAVFGAEGRTGKLDAALIALEHAATAHARVRHRAQAVQLLRSVMSRHRDTARLRYVEPFRTEIQRLGCTVFGPTFEVDVDSDLRICSRTLDGRTVPFDSLSGGAREQLGVIARLAVAALVDKQDAVPVMIDDALGFTDADRLTKMGRVLDVAGAHGQVIVLTCLPDRYRGVEGAHHIEVSASKQSA
ncbi:ATP-binding protein [Mycolicibacterium palauense]|uniref:ATP-binding protein n=1 Tax=Mycolicibacterium palauense TaxID=2034511 RepID=UPI000BFEC614|nr:ATP-binding protein [Mycolicibacterium palauense]